MKISTSTSTVRAYENRKRKMNLHYDPVLFFEDSWPFPIENLQNKIWTIESEMLGRLQFDVTTEVDSPFEVRTDRNYVSFSLTLSDVPFQPDPYECKLSFNAQLVTGHSQIQEMQFSTWGIVKTIWRNGLR
jgi:hypothetical protein